MNANQKNQIAAALFGQPTFDGLQRVSATAVGDSANGLVTIEFDDGSQIEADTIGAITDGETVQVDVQNGHATVIGAAGWGDRLYVDVDGLQTLVHEYSGGVLVAKVGQSYGALVNANGSFDVVELTWSGDVFTIGDAVATFGGTVEIKVPDGNNGYGYFQITANGKISAKKYTSGSFTNSGLIYENGELEVYNSNGSIVLTADSWGAKASNQSIVTSAYKYSGPGDTDPALYVSGNYTTQTDPDDVFPHEALPIFKIATYTHTSSSIAVGGGASISAQSLSSRVPTGYKAVAVASVNSNHAQNWYVGGSYINVANQTIAFSYKHAFGSGSEKCTFNFYLLCVPAANVG